MSKPSLRIITTNDFYGSYFSRPASYGRQPGAQSLVNMVARLREEVPASLWVDDGDFAQGGPLAPASAGTYGFAAVRELGIDVSAIGNHEFDWGEQHLTRWAGEPGFALLSANYDVGLPPYAVLNAGPFSVGVIGLTHPGVGQFNDTLDKSQPAPVELVADLSAELRTSGVDVVILAIHDGVDWATTRDGPLAIDTGRMQAFCASVAGHVEAVIGGHTLGQHIGHLAGVPFVHPWAFGAEVGVLDRQADGSWEVVGVMLGEDEDWRGAGTDVHSALAAEIVGESATPLSVKPFHSNSLAEVMASGMSRLTEADIAVVFPQQLQTMQSPIDGTFAYLAAGEISEADVMRVVPFVGEVIDQTVLVFEATRAEVVALLEAAAGKRPTDVDVALSPQTWGGPAIVRRGGGNGVVSVAVASLYSEARLAEKWVGRSLEWNATSFGLRDALRAGVSA
jgi:2',3'-cyclic-nucleotide 2'-phosphodiesterase (5'-nucleotidase family)